MPSPSRLAHVLGVALLASLVGCATPGAPTGGPVDSTPPTLMSSLPADLATGVTDSTITLVFSERLDRASASAVTVTPASATPPRVEVDGREIRVVLPGLRDSTTYVVTLGTGLKDNRNVALRSPITFAFATGDAIDRAQITGRVRDPSTGSGVQAAVWAYALADSASVPAPDVPPDYRTETGADGAFSLSYLRRAPYFVVAVQDRNRNGRLDPGERVAAPPRLVLRADTTASDPETFWIAAPPDTIPPRAQRVRTLSDRRLAVRFDESVRLSSPDAAGWTLADSASGAAVAVRLYQVAESPQDVFVQADRPLPAVPHRIAYVPSDTLALADSSGRAAQAFILAFTSSARPDTVTARFLGFAPVTRDSVATLAPGQRPSARFSSPLPADGLRQRVRLAVGGEPQSTAFVSADGVTWQPSGALPASFEVVVEMPDSTFRQRYAVATARETGGVVGRVEGQGPVRVEVRPTSGDPVVAAVGGDGAFAVDGLLPGAYTLRIWRDLDGDGQWTPGLAFPYREPEPLRLLLDPVQVRARWEADVEPVTL